jgi:hypothetical protein
MRRRDYYLHRRYLESYGDEELRELNDLLDSQVVSLLGYETLERS